MAPKVMGVAVASKRYENDACEWAEGRRVPRDVRSSPPERENHSRWVSHSRGKERGLSVAPSLHTNAGGSTSCSLREKLGVGEEICSHCGERVRCRLCSPRPSRWWSLVASYGLPGSPGSRPGVSGRRRGSRTLRGSAFFLGDSDRGVGTWWRCGSWAPCVKNRAVDRRVSRVPE